jgi:RimJ/RimL family protein N-acetyltransferase
MEPQPLDIPPAPDFAVGPPLSDAALARAASLPQRPAPVELIGQRIRLVPTDPARDAAPLYAVSNGTPIRVGDLACAAYDADRLVWRYLRQTTPTDPATTEAYLTQLCAAPDLLALTMLEQQSGHPVGIMTFMANQPAHLKIELGNIWVSPIMQGRRAVHTGAYLMLRHSFQLGYRRVEWKCDALNLRSRRTALRLGFTFEGIQEYHYIVKGRSRDTAWFRMLDHEWPKLRATLETWLDEQS